MKNKIRNVSIIIASILLGGCAAGINHNVANINGKPYLIETHKRGLFLKQWSEPSIFHSLDGDIDNIAMKQKITEIVKSCKSIHFKQMNKTTSDYKEVLNCINEKIK